MPSARRPSCASLRTASSQRSSPAAARGSRRARVADAGARGERRVRQPAPPAVEATAYFFVAEALTNVAKHARARHAKVTARLEDGTLVVHVRDDGMGGARPDGSGLLGLADRVASLD